MLPAEVSPHVDTSSSRLVGRIEGHSNSTRVQVVTKDRSWRLASECKLLHKHPKVKGFYSCFRKGAEFCFLRSKACYLTEFDFPATMVAAPFKKKDVGVG